MQCNAVSVTIQYNETPVLNQPSWLASFPPEDFWEKKNRKPFKAYCACPSLSISFWCTCLHQSLETLKLNSSLAPSIKGTYWFCLKTVLPCPLMFIINEGLIKACLIPVAFLLGFYLLSLDLAFISPIYLSICGRQMILKWKFNCGVSLKNLLVPPWLQDTVHIQYELTMVFRDPQDLVPSLSLLPRLFSFKFLFYWTIVHDLQLLEVQWSHV